MALLIFLVLRVNFFLFRDHKKKCEECEKILLSQMCTGTYVAFSPLAPLDFKSKFQSAFNWYTFCTRLTEYSLVLGHFLPLIISTVNASFTFPKDVKGVIDTAIPVIIVFFTMLSCLFVKFRNYKHKDVQSLLSNSTYFIVAPKLEDNDAIEMTAVQIDGKDEKDATLLRLKYQETLFGFL
jgi:hypothetical protein